MALTPMLRPATPPVAHPAPTALKAPPTPPTPFWTKEGTANADTLTGTANNDRLYGAAGNDTISGLAGNDLLVGGTGVNKLTGGDGADTFLFAKGDVTAGAINVITDFSSAQHDHVVFLGFGRPTLTTSLTTAQTKGGVYEHAVTGGLQLDVYLPGTTTSAATVQLLGVSTITQADIGGGFGPPHHH